MNPKTRAWLLILLIATLCAGTLWGVIWYRSRSLAPAAMLKRLPTSDAVVLYLDFAKLRGAGILQLLDGSKVGEDPEYRNFVRQTEFDYKQDLDAAMVSFAPTGKYMLLRGRFDWKALKNYAQATDGRCNNSFCKMAGSSEEKRISFFPLQSGLMALAVSRDDVAALRMNEVDNTAPASVPDAPVWLSIPPSVVRSGASLPPGTQMFARSLERAQSVILSVVPAGEAFAAKLDVKCANSADAAALADELSKTTNLLKEMIEREHQTPNPADLSGFLTSGSFKSEGSRALGYWRISKELINNLLGAT